MVIDTPALLAVLQNEPERRAFNEAIEAAETRFLSAASFVESSMIVESRYGVDGIRDLDLFIAKANSNSSPSMWNRPILPGRLFEISAGVTSRVIRPVAEERDACAYDRHAGRMECSHQPSARAVLIETDRDRPGQLGFDTVAS